MIQLFTPSNAQYDKYSITTQNKIGMSFRVKGCQEATIALRNGNVLKYEIKIGINNNQRSSVRILTGRPKTENTPNILDCNTGRYFWATWQS